MASVTVRCPHCGSDEVIKRGKTDTGGQRYRCRNEACAQGSFLLEYRYQGYLPRVKRQIVDMALNGSGIRDTARVLGISKDTVVSELKKQTELEPINRPFLDRLADPARPILLARVEEAEADEMWSFVGKKTEPRWLWQALDHRTGTVLAYVFGRREDQAFLELKALLEPFGIRRFFTDGWGAYRRHLEPTEHEVGKRFTQQLERKHLTLRTRIKRLVRKTICFSKTIEMHDTVIGLFINRYEFGRAV
jgi:insertion element IS1 protein InsB